MEPFILGPGAGRTFLAVQRCALPRSRGFSEAQTAEGLRLVNRLLAEKPGGVRRQLGLFLLLVEALSFLAGGARFQELGPERQKRVLGWLFDADVPLLRKGFWGLNTLVKLSVYGQPSVYGAIGYVRRAVTHD